MVILSLYGYLILEKINVTNAKVILKVNLLILLLNPSIYEPVKQMHGKFPCHPTYLPSRPGSRQTATREVSWIPYYKYN